MIHRPELQTCRASWPVSVNKPGLLVFIYLESNKHWVLLKCNYGAERWGRVLIILVTRKQTNLLRVPSELVEAVASVVFGDARGFRGEERKEEWSYLLSMQVICKSLSPSAPLLYTPQQGQKVQTEKSNTQKKSEHRHWKRVVFVIFLLSKKKQRSTQTNKLSWARGLRQPRAP